MSGHDWTTDPDAQARIAGELPGLLALARRLARDEQTAEDAVQDAMERAWRSRDQLRDPHAVGSWLHTILARRVADLHRARWDLPAGAPEALQDLMPDVQDAEALVAAAEDEYALRSALRQLAEPDRLALVLHDSEGWPAAEIADLLGIATEATHKRIQRARVRLVTALAHPSGATAPPTGACVSARAHAHGLLDGTLDPANSDTIQAHLDSCPRCPAALQAATGVLNALRANDTATAVPQLLRAHLDDLLREADEAP